MRSSSLPAIELLNIDEIIERYKLDITRETLENGLKVAVIEDHSVPLASVNLYYLVGSRNESYGKTGVSHFLEHMMFKGTDRLGPEEISAIITSWGGVDNAATGKDFTVYWALIPSGRLYDLLVMEADRMENAKFRDFDSEKMVIMEERRLLENNPYGVLLEEMDALAIKAHPYRHPIIGWMSDIEHLQTEDLLNHYSTYYVPNNAYLVISGDVEPQQAISWVRELFGHIPKRPHQDVITREPEQKGERRAHLTGKDWPEVWAAAYHIPELSHPDSVPLALALSILSDGRASRLHTKLVESGLATDVTIITEKTLDPFIATIMVTPSMDVSFETIDGVVSEELQKLAAEGPSEEEFIRIVNKQTTYFIMGQETVMGKAQTIGELDIMLGEDGYLTVLKRFSEIKPEDIKQVVGKYLVKTNRSVITMEGT